MRREGRGVRREGREGGGKREGREVRREESR